MFKYLNHLVISKFVMAFSGAYLLLFITGHLVGNLQLFMGREPFNAYANFLQSIGEVLWAERIVLIIAAILHIITSIYLKLHNYKLRGEKYAVRKYVKAGLNSRTMIWTGLMILAFVIFHLLHFTFGVIDSKNYNYQELYTKNAYAISFAGDIEQANQQSMSMEALNPEPIVYERHDVYKMVIMDFRNPWVSLFYMIAVALLGVHISHSLQSAFQTLGISGPRFTRFIRPASIIYGFFIGGGFLIIPLSVLLGLIGGNI
jgi:succinate dehydrogenase / fumarate reductase cytochrome b subunit